MAEPPPFPNTEAGDSDDVSWALETGKSMWQRGELQDGLRWLKRASETASEEGNDMRSLSLAMAAANLRTYCAAQAQPAAGAAPPTTMVLEDEEAAAQQRPSAQLLEAVAEAKALARQKQQAAAATAPPAPASWPQAGGTGVPGQHSIPIARDEDEGPTLIPTKEQRQKTAALIRQLESARTTAGPPPLPQRAQGVAPPAARPASAPPAPSQPVLAQPASALPAPSQPVLAQPAPQPAPAQPVLAQPAFAPPASAPPAPSQPVLAQPAPQPALAQPAHFQPAASAPAFAEVARHDAVRVAVQPVEGRPGVYIARPLKPGEKPGPGARAALLVALKPSTPVLF